MGVEFAGIELRDLRIEKGISQLQNFIMALRIQGITQQIALIAVSWMQLLVGTQKSFFIDVSTPLPHLYSMKWLLTIRSFLHLSFLTLESELDCTPPLQCL